MRGYDESRVMLSAVSSETMRITLNRTGSGHRRPPGGTTTVTAADPPPSGGPSGGPTTTPAVTPAETPRAGHHGDVLDPWE